MPPFGSPCTVAFRPTGRFFPRRGRGTARCPPGRSSSSRRKSARHRPCRHRRTGNPGGAERVRAAGVQNVLVVPEHRKSDLFRQIMSVAMAEALRRQLDLGILFCTADLAQNLRLAGMAIVKGSKRRSRRRAGPFPVPSREKRDHVLSADACGYSARRHPPAGTHW